MTGGGTAPSLAPSRWTATARTCSACAFESCSRPVSAAGSSTWNGETRAIDEVTGTTVTTPRPRRTAVVFAPSSLTITAGRRLSASAPLSGSGSTSRISPRRTTAAWWMGLSRPSKRRKIRPHELRDHHARLSRRPTARQKLGEGRVGAICGVSARIDALQGDLRAVEQVPRWLIVGLEGITPYK
jgi:hypothetical protein